MVSYSWLDNKFLSRKLAQRLARLGYSVRAQNNLEADCVRVSHGRASQTVWFLLMANAWLSLEHVALSGVAGRSMSGARRGRDGAVPSGSPRRKDFCYRVGRQLQAQRNL